MMLTMMMTMWWDDKGGNINDNNDDVNNGNWHYPSQLWEHYWMILRSKCGVRCVVLGNHHTEHCLQSQILTILGEKIWYQELCTLQDSYYCHYIMILVFRHPYCLVLCLKRGNEAKECEVKITRIAVTWDVMGQFWQKRYQLKLATFPALSIFNFVQL